MLAIRQADQAFLGMCSQNTPHRIGNVALPFQGSVFNKLDPPVPSAQVGQDPTVHEAHVWEGWVGWVEICNFHAKRLQNVWKGWVGWVEMCNFHAKEAAIDTAV